MTDSGWSAEEPGTGTRSRPSLARPYSWTEGRTQPAVDLPIEAQVETTAEGARLPYNRGDVRSVLIQLCRQPRSMAEIAAEMSMPLGVARVLISDLVSSGLVTVLATLSEDASWKEKYDLFERVLSGLRAI